MNNNSCQLCHCSHNWWAKQLPLLDTRYCQLIIHFRHFGFVARSVSVLDPSVFRWIYIYNSLSAEAMYQSFSKNYHIELLLLLLLLLLMFYGSVDFVRDNPGELVPKETFTHPSYPDAQPTMSKHWRHCWHYQIEVNNICALDCFKLLSSYQYLLLLTELLSSPLIFPLLVAEENIWASCPADTQQREKLCK